MPNIPTTTLVSLSQPIRKQRVSTEQEDVKQQTADKDVLRMSDSEEERVVCLKLYIVYNDMSNLIYVGYQSTQEEED